MENGVFHNILTFSADLVIYFDLCCACFQFVILSGNGISKEGK